MGLTQNRIENSKSQVNKQKETIPVSDDRSQDSANNDEGQSIVQHSFQTTPISIPQFFIKMSPFTFFAFKDSDENDKMSQSSLIKQENQERQKLKQKDDSDREIILQNHSWMEVVYHSALFSRILQYLSPQNDENLMLVNHRVYSEIFLHRLLIRDNNWLSALAHIKSQSHLQELYWKMAQYQEESQHSLDLDRTESFFHTETSEIVDKGCQIAKLDRIMKALTASSVPYSQGINAIVAKLLSFFEEETAYWMVVFLLKKTKNIHNDCQTYQNFMDQIQVLIEQKLPKIHKKLDDLDFNVEYFAMKWVMSLFSYDFNRQVLFYLWDIVLLFDGLQVIKMFILSLFEELQEEILKEKYDRDQINSLIKHQLKETVDLQMGQRIIKRMKIHLIINKYGNDFLNFYDLRGQSPPTVNIGYQLQSARKYSRNSDDINFMHLLDSPKEDKFNAQIEEQPQQLEESNNCSNIEKYSGDLEQNQCCQSSKDRQQQDDEEDIGCEKEMILMVREKLLVNTGGEMG